MGILICAALHITSDMTGKILSEIINVQPNSNQGTIFSPKLHFVFKAVSLM